MIFWFECGSPRRAFNIVLLPYQDSLHFRLSNSLVYVFYLCIMHLTGVLFGTFTSKNSHTPLWFFKFQISRCVFVFRFIKPMSGEQYFTFQNCLTCGTPTNHYAGRSFPPLEDDVNMWMTTFQRLVMEFKIIWGDWNHTTLRESSALSISALRKWHCFFGLR